MKILKLIILVLFLVLSLAPEGHCGDEHDLDVAVTHHCVVTCHSCHTGIIPQVDKQISFVENKTLSSVVYSFHYQDPILDQIQRPPIVSI